MSASVMAIFGKPILPTNWMQMILITAHCVTFIFSTPLSMLAAQYISGNTVNLVFSTSAVLMLITQYTILSSILPGNRNWIEVAGVVLVLFGSAMGSVLELCKSK